MFGIGLGEFILILVVALIFISPEKLPEIAKAMAKIFNEFKKAGAEIRRTVSDISFEEASRAADLQKAAASHKPLEGAEPPQGVQPPEGAGNGQKEAASVPEPEKDAGRASPFPGANEEKKG
ncbi:MAG: twin-arginine translocase TatA/TatE family subunit [Deltaproteobacteria bacterium]|nr:twin-arginine translocase TatA/TatE family subunit [Deltaproteobacteria bacterium]